MIKIALAGNPNCGKTTMFNALTGASQYVGNWPGVTVEKKEGKLKGNKEVSVIDLPGIYSLSPYTLEEVVSRNYLIDEKPDVIINLVDGSNIERNLYLTTQLLEVGIPVVVALNMIDIVHKRGDAIDTDQLADRLGCPVVETSALKETGLDLVCQTAIRIAWKKEPVQVRHEFAAEVEKAISDISNILISAKKVDEKQIRWYSVKLFERDEKAMRQLGVSAETLNAVEGIVLECEERYGDDAESIITNERYIYISSVVKDCVKKKKRGVKMSASDKIDRVVTNRWLALPIFAVVIFLVYYISVSTIGTFATDFVNDGIFGDGWHLFGIGTAEYEEKAEEFENASVKLKAYLAAAEEAGIDISSMEEALAFDGERISEEAVVITQNDADAVIEAFLMSAEAANLTAVAEFRDEDGNVEENVSVACADFEAAMLAEEPDPSDYGIWISGIPSAAEQGLDAINCADWLKGLVLDGILGGVGSVLGFLPQMLVLFLLLAILEDCGYMARIAFIMDRIFRKFGLSGKSFIPILIGTGCGVPGIMASRTIENERDRKMTIMVTTFIPCGAKLPIIALIAGALFGGNPWIAPSAYFVGIFAIIFSGISLKKTRAFAGEPAPFVMELPEYHIPGVKGIFIHMWDRGKSFVKKAGTIIFLACVLVWFLSSFNWRMQMVEEAESMLAVIGSVIAPVFSPLGFGNWQSAVAAITGLIAKENVVGTFGVLYGAGEIAENGLEIWTNMRQSFTPVSGYAFLVFNLLCAPCFAAIGAIKREMGSWKWTGIAVGYQCLMAYALAFIINQFGGFILGTHGFGAGTVIAASVVIGMIYMLARRGYRPKKGNVIKQRMVSV